MQTDVSGDAATLALSTKLEEDFITPLTAVRGMLEIIRDHDDLTGDERKRFVNSALDACSRLESGIDDLANRVYATASTRSSKPEEPPTSRFAARFQMLPDQAVMDIDQSDLVFASATIVNEFFDAVEACVEATGRDWYFTVNFRDCAIWPEAWVAYAHRSKRLGVSHGLGTVRYSSEASAADQETGNMLLSRTAAIEFLTQQ